MNNYLFKPELKRCLNCGFAKIVDANHCPRCSRPLFTEDNVRKKGCFSTIFGLIWMFAVLGFAAFLIFIYIAADVQPKSREELETRHRILFALLMFCGFALSFGCGFVFSGIWQIIFAKPNYVVLWLSVLAGLFIEILIFIIRAF